MTKTETKRQAFPLRYLRKNARTAIYTALYGRSEHTFNRHIYKRPNEPSLDVNRHLPFHWEWHTAEQVFKASIEDAQFNPATRAMLEARLEQLKHYRHKQPAE